MPISPLNKVRTVMNIAVKGADTKIDTREMTALFAIADLKNPAVAKLMVGLYKDGPRRFGNAEQWRQFGNGLENRGVKVGKRPLLPIGNLPEPKSKKGLQPLQQVKAAIASLVHADDGKLSRAELQTVLSLSQTPNGKQLDTQALQELVKQYKAGDSRFEGKTVRGALRTELLRAGVKSADLGAVATQAEFDKLSKNDKMQTLFPEYQPGQDEELFGAWLLDASFKTRSVNAARDFSGEVKARAVKALDDQRKAANTNLGGPESWLQKPEIRAVSRDGKLFGYTVACAGTTWEQTKVYDRNFQPIGKFEIFE